MAKPSCGSCNGSCAGTCNLCAGCSSGNRKNIMKYIKIFFFKITNNCNFHTLAAQPQIFADQLDRERPNFLNINESQIAFPKDGTKIIFPKNETVFFN